MPAQGASSIKSSDFVCVILLICIDMEPSTPNDRLGVLILYIETDPHPTLLEKKGATWNPFCPVFRTLGGKGSQKGSLHFQEPKKVPYITKNGSKELT